LVLQGINDHYGTAAQVESIASKAPKAQKMLIEKSGHSPHQEQPEKTLEVMKRFLIE
jgi:pimeloyl-ACP methyl ester carboxylesterase